MFGCDHENYSFPQTPKRPNRIKAAALTGTYVVCLKCSKDLPYDWINMEIVNEKSLDSVAQPYWRRIMRWRRHS
jgi:hypothetical protein